MSIGEEIKHQTLRDTKTFYLNAPDTLFFSGLIDFAVRHCGKRVLDLGCATGNYIVELQRKGYDCVGADVNPAYVDIARKRGIEVYLVGDTLPFPDKSFDSVVMFEVTEHLPNPGAVLTEARRVARKNVLLTVPNCEGYDHLKKQGVIYEHFLDADHKNYFTESSMRELLSRLFSKIEIRRGDPIFPLALVDLSKHTFLRVLFKLRLIQPKYYFRLYVVAHIDNGHEGSA